MTPAGPVRQVFWAFLALGLTSFGGPIAHLGYFRRAFVERRAWLSEAEYASLVALCQLLPGPASSQVGFCIGRLRAGWPGALAAWLGFTMPSAVLMFGLAAGAARLQTNIITQHALHGLQLAAVAVVAQAVWTMALSLCPDLPRRILAVLAMALLILVPGAGGQILVLLVGGLIGVLALDQQPAPDQASARTPDPATSLSKPIALACLAAFLVILALSFSAFTPPGLALFGAFYRTGALVFGGGHVVLPLLGSAIVAPAWVSPPLFLTGYGLAQAMPGPLFTVATFLGAVCFGNQANWINATLATIAIFLPGLLLVSAALPFWHRLRGHTHLAPALLGINAAVVGLLGYALLGLLSQGVLHRLTDVPILLLALAGLIRFRSPPILVVGFCALAAVLV